jgi:hypothetical protein
MNEYCHGERPIDVAFVGEYSRHHSARVRKLEKVAGLACDYQIVPCLDVSRLKRLAETTLGRLLPLYKHQHPPTPRGRLCSDETLHAPRFGKNRT